MRRRRADDFAVANRFVRGPPARQASNSQPKCARENLEPETVMRPRSITWRRAAR